MSTVVLDTPAGQMRAEQQGEILVARGLPFGRAERFDVASTIPAWNGVRDATRPGPVCPQPQSYLDRVSGPVVAGLTPSEDCLVLSVTSPIGADRLPVMVWLHGGVYMFGGGEAPKYDPGLLVREGNVVVVNVTYRLGLLGYLGAAGRGVENLGLLDQLLALRWVRANIAALGGDPDRVTVFGHSAGGDSVLSLILSPAADGLFQRAIVQSAPLGLRDGRDKMTAELGLVARRSLGDDPAGPDIDAVLQAQAAVVDAARRFGSLGGFPLAPVLGAAPLPTVEMVPARLAEAAQRVELFVGSTRDDGAPFVAVDPRARQLARLGRPGRALVRAITKRVTDAVFRVPAQELAKTWRGYGGRATTYRFDWAPPGAPLGACHFMELPFLFESRAWRDAPMLGGSSADSRLAAELRRTWAAFAHHGLGTSVDGELVFA